MGRKQKSKLRSRARDRPNASALQTARNMTAGQAQSRGVNLSYPRQRVSRASLDMASNETIYAAVTRIANALATMPVRLYRGTELMAGDPRDTLLALRPNRRQSAYQFKMAMEIYRNTEGRAYAVKRFDAGGNLKALECVNPTDVTPLEDAETGEIWYAIRRADGVTEYLHNWYVLSLFHASTNGVTGVRVVDVLRGTMDYAAQVETFNLSNLQGVNHAIVLDFPQAMDRIRRERLIAEMLEIYRQNGGKVIALDAGVRATNLNGTAIDAKAFDVERVTRSKVATVYNLPPHLLGDTSDAAAGTQEQQNIEFLTLTMVPPTVQWMEELNYKMLTPADRAEGWEYRFDYEAYLRADGATLANIRQSQIRCGSRTINEIRAKDYLPPVEGGDVPFVSKDLAPVHLVAKGATIDQDALNGEKNARKTSSVTAAP